MFHGPSFQCLTGEIVIGDQGLACELEVRSPEGLFRSTRCPTTPRLPDLARRHRSDHGRLGLRARPLCLSRLDLGNLKYIPQLRPSEFACRCAWRLLSLGAETLYANVEIQDGAGAVWMRIADWRSWKFRWDNRLVDFRRLPHKYLLGQAASVTKLD